VQLFLDAQHRLVSDANDAVRKPLRLVILGDGHCDSSEVPITQGDVQGQTCTLLTSGRRHVARTNASYRSLVPRLGQ
jgi:hypothetical protein